ncbi:MAG TPA: MerR family transcriptional regulator [Ornithinibacter sp.]|nr:MerR family transcriptional regulator [Ornithinibacter sp.]
MAVPAPRSDRGVYGISVAADLVGMGVQNLRLYEARGLLQPQRTDGGTRRYSANDLDRLRRIGDLLEAGLNLAGIGMVLHLEAENARLRKTSRPRRALRDVGQLDAVIPGAHRLQQAEEALAGPDEEDAPNPPEVGDG